MKTTSTQRILSLALAFLVLMNGFGVFVFDYAQVGYHRIFERESSEKEAQTLQLSGSEFSSIVWVGDKDFIYNGNVYDCAGFSSSKGKIIVNCYIDHEETSVKKSLADNFENGAKNPNSTNPVKDLLKLFPVFSDFEKLNISSAENSSVLNFNIFNSGNLSPAETELISPPPQLG